MKSAAQIIRELGTDKANLSAEVARLRLTLAAIVTSAETALPATSGPCRYDVGNILTLAREALE